MADPGNPQPDQDGADRRQQRETDGVDHDDSVGFSSVRSLMGQMRKIAGVEPGTEAEPHVGPSQQDNVVTSDPRQSSRPVVADFASRIGAGVRDEGKIQGLDSGKGLLSVYLLILLAIPTGGVSGLVALLAVWQRQPSQDQVEASHALFQKRTVYFALIAAVVGAVLILVSLGVTVLFVLGLWIIARSVRGITALRSGHALSRPMTYLV